MNNDCLGLTLIIIGLIALAIVFPPVIILYLIITGWLMLKK